MTPPPLDRQIMQRLRERRALLWVCQRYDLLPDRSPHPYHTPADEAAACYRTAPDPTDAGLAALYWEAVWLEGAASPLLRAVEQASESAGAAGRAVVTLVSRDDAEATMPEVRLLPACVLPGRLGQGVPADKAYGALTERKRRQAVEALTERLERYPGRVLVVLGADGPDDLDAQLYPALKEGNLVDLWVLAVVPAGRPPLPPPDNPAVRFTAWPGTAAGLLALLTAADAPRADEPDRLSVLVRDRTIALPADALSNVPDEFAVLTTADLLPPKQFALDDLRTFLEGGDLKMWAGYAAGYRGPDAPPDWPLPRAYRPTTDPADTLPGLVLDALSVMSDWRGKPDDPVARRRTMLLKLPAAGGSGATTLLRQVAYTAAKEGYPTLVLRPGATDIDLDRLTAFCTAVTEATLAAQTRPADGPGGKPDLPAFLLAVDADASDLPAVRKLRSKLAAAGRPAVIVQVVTFVGETDAHSQASEPPEPGQDRTLRPLLAGTTAPEARECAAAFLRFQARYPMLAIDARTADDWLAYEANTKWVLPGNRQGGEDHSQGETLFWVALRFFLTGGLTFRQADQIRAVLGAWLRDRAALVTDPSMQRVVDWVAALSAHRIVCPLTTALRPEYAGGFSSRVVAALQQLGELVDWGGYSDVVRDQLIRFRHPALGEEYLYARHGAASPQRVTELLYPLIDALSPGSEADRWVAERLVRRVLVPGRGQRWWIPPAEWNWRLDVFKRFPPAVASQNRVVLHHWARCLYRSARVRRDELADGPGAEPGTPPADPDELPMKKREERIAQAIQYLEAARQLPARQLTDDHPSHLLTSLGTAWGDRAKLQQETGRPEEAAASWQQAVAAFGGAVGLLPDNLDALQAYARALQERAAREPADARWADAVHALDLLERADDLQSQTEGQDPDRLRDIRLIRSRVLELLNDAEGYLEQLTAAGQEETAAYCQAQLILQRSPTPTGVMQAVAVLAPAVAGPAPSPAVLRLTIRLYRRLPTLRHDFPRHLSLYERLTRPPAKGRPADPPNLVDLFRLAVLYYQVDQPEKGADTFRRLRDASRQGEVTAISVKDVWKDRSDPEKPRRATVQVTRLLNEWRAEGYVAALRQTVPLRPRNFSRPPRLNEVVECGIRFEFQGPIAVPPDFVQPRRRP